MLAGWGFDPNSAGTGDSVPPASAWRSAWCSTCSASRHLGDGRASSRAGGLATGSRQTRSGRRRSGSAAGCSCSSRSASRSPPACCRSPRSRSTGAYAYLLLAVTVGFFGWLFLAGDWTPVERKRLYIIGVFFVAAALFWSVFEQAGSTLNLFADRSTSNVVLGCEFPSSWFQSVNALFIFIARAGVRVALGHARDRSSRRARPSSRSA